MTVQRACNQPRRRRLANSARAGKEIRVMQTIVRDRVLQRPRQNFLAGYVLEFLWAPLARDYLVGHVVILDLRLPIFNLKAPVHELSANQEESDSGLTRNTRGTGYRCSVPGLAGFTEPTLCGARSLISHCRFPIANCRLEACFLLRALVLK